MTGVAAALVSAGPALVASPMISLTVGLGIVGLLSDFVGRDAQRPWWAPRPITRGSGGRAAALTATGMWLMTSVIGDRGGLVILAVHVVSIGIATLLLAGQWSTVIGSGVPGAPGRRRVLGIAVGLLLAACGVIAAGLGDPARGLDIWALALVVAAALPQERARSPDIWEPVLGHPARLLVLTFLALAVAGGVVLSLPICSSSGDGVGLLDGLFTAVSAVCVTGLIVLDTPDDFSVAGQAVILVLIQAGGLGIMTFSTAAIRLLGRRLSLRHEGAVAQLMSAEDRSQLYDAARNLIAVTVISEVAGALLLAVAFMRHDADKLQAVWRAVFTSISAFCNAGFALQSDSLIRYQNDPLVIHVVGALIILGGLSPVVVLAVIDLGRGRRSLTPQVRLALATTVSLLAGGFVVYLAMEWSATLAALSFTERLHNAWFQSVTLRTAGFNSVDIAQCAPATLSVMMAFMFVGGNPGGTAGGVKTITVAVLVLAVVAAIRGRAAASAHGRTLSHRTVYRAAAIVTVGVLIALIAVLAIQLTQTLSVSEGLFEVVSALGTVGLSIGGTAKLDSVGKVIIMVCMFAGRVGPLTLFMFLATRSSSDPWTRPEIEMDVG